MEGLEVLVHEDPVTPVGVFLVGEELVVEGQSEEEAEWIISIHRDL